MVFLDEQHANHATDRRVGRQKGLVVFGTLLSVDQTLDGLPAAFLPGTLGEAELVRAVLSRATAKVRPEQAPPRPACRAETRLANHRVSGLRKAKCQKLQDLSGDLPAGRRRDSRGARQGRSWLICLLLHRPASKRPRNSGSVRRPGYD